MVIFLYSGKLKSLHTDNVHYTAGGATCVEINKLINPGSPPDLGPTPEHCVAWTHFRLKLELTLLSKYKVSDVCDPTQGKGNI